MKYKKTIMFINTIMKSLLGTIGISLYISSLTNNNDIFNNVITIPIFIIIYFFEKKAKKIRDKKIKIGSIIFSILYTLFIVLGTQLEYYADISWTIKTLFTIMLLFLPIYLCSKYLLYFCESFNIKMEVEKNFKHQKIIIFLIILIGNLLTYLALFPGVYGYDAGFQILEFANPNISLTTHFSIIYSYFLYACVTIGKNLFHSYQIGFAIYTLLQMIFIVFVTSKITTYIFKKTNNIYLLYCCLIFFALFPLHTIMAVSSSQDVIFSGIFALIILELIKYADKDIHLNILEIIKLIFLFSLLIMFRNNGKYALLFAIPFILIFNKERLKFVIIIISSFAIYQIYSGPFFNYLKVTKESPIIEMSSIPSQQLARVYNYSYDNLTKEEIKGINTLYPNHEFHYYTVNQLISDAMKKDFNPEEFNHNSSKYIKLYFQIGMKEYKNYIEAFLLNNLGLWYPNKKYYDSRMYHPYIEFNMIDTKVYDKYITIKRNSKFHLYEKVLSYIVEDNNWTKLPIISSLFQVSTYFHLLILAIILTIIRKQTKLLPILSLYFGLYATVILSPVILFRYNYAFILCLPLTLYIIFHNKKII